MPEQVEGCSPESKVRQNSEGKDVSKLKFSWAAKWITHPDASTLDYGVFLFRRSFKLEEVPAEFLVFVSADNRYRLFVNGKPVCSGPALGDLEHYRYETIDIAPYLGKGKNLIAAEVVNFGEYRRAAQISYQTAFILQCNVFKGLKLNTGEGGWRVIQNMAYKAIPFGPADLEAYYCAGPGDILEGKLYPWGWEYKGFDDSSWLMPRVATVEFAVGRGFLFGSTWFLVPRKIPFMEEVPQRFQNIARTLGKCDSLNFLEGKSPICISPGSIVSILFDHGVHTVAYPKLSFSGGAGSKIKLTYSEALFFPEGGKGNRNELEGKHIFGVYDLLYPDGGENRLFRPLWKRTFRFLQLDIETSKCELFINDFTSVFSGYPFKELASFKSDDVQLDKIWEVAWRTLRNGTDEIYQDTPYYEQLQYIGDTRLSSLVSIYVSGDDRLMRKAIEQFDDSRSNEGILLSRYPAYIKQFITPFSLFWIGMIHDYFMYCNDPEFVKTYLPGIRGVLEWFERRIDKSGMLANLEWWSFTDWVSAFPNGSPPGAENGHSANITLQYVYAIKSAIKLFMHFGWQWEAEKYRKLSKDIKEAVFNTCFDKSKGLFAETHDQKMFTQHTNIMAVLSDAVEEDMQCKIASKLIDNEDLVESTLYFKFYLFRALQKTGMGDEYLSQLEPWKKMLSEGLTTFAESEHHTRSDCHPWSATPCFDFLHTVAGIYPEEPGFNKIMIAPNFGYLQEIKANMPHPCGAMIEVNLAKKGSKGISGSICLPEGYEGTFIWNRIKYNLRPGKQEIQL